jgi:uncharacterized protein (DUF924 family)
MRVPDPAEVLGFWFGDPEADAYREAWFRRDTAFDEEVRRRFAETHAAVAAGDCEWWLDTPRGALAYVIVLDQFSRNLFRDSPKAWAQDAAALAAARSAIERGFDRALPRYLRMFLYLPFEHSESLTDQERSVALFADLGDEKAYDYALRHREIIQRFGRFPHRNAVLGRVSTPEEIAFLREPGSSF